MVLRITDLNAQSWRPRRPLFRVIRLRMQFRYHFAAGQGYRPPRWVQMLVIEIDAQMVIDGRQDIVRIEPAFARAFAVPRRGADYLAHLHATA